MFSLRTAFERTLLGHLPLGFDPASGLRSLFPPHTSAALSSLTRYLYSRNYGVTTGEINCTFYIRADGAGGWYAATLIGGSSGVNQRVRDGFVFRYSDSASGHGYIFGDVEDLAVGSGQAASGQDPWIATHWPQVFAADSYVELQQATGLVSLPDESEIWTDAGFDGLEVLPGGLLPPVSGSGGGAGFPGPSEWDIPPDD